MRAGAIRRPSRRVPHPGDNPPVDGDPGTVGAPLGTLGSEDYLYLTTKGRVSGTPHRIEIWFALSGATAYLLSGGGERSDWVRNLRADPSVRVRIGDRDLTATARVVDPATEAARDAAVERFGKITLLVNNAGLVTMTGFDELTEDEWDFVMDVNLKGMFIVSQVVTPSIAAAGGGAVVNLATIEAEVVVASGPHCQPHYNASKGGVRMFTKALAHELGPRNIRVNAVAPAVIDT